MSDAKTGGSAFPNQTKFIDKTHEHYLGDKYQGMTLRDYFAAKAMQAWLTDPEVSWEENNLSWVADRAYRAADAMLKEREQ